MLPDIFSFNGYEIEIYVGHIIPKGNLDSLLRDGIIETDQYVSGITGLGFTDTAVQDFTTQITIQIEERRIEDEARAARGEEAAEKEKPLSRTFSSMTISLSDWGLGANSSTELCDRPKVNYMFCRIR